MSSFLKRGAAAHVALAAERTAAEQRQKETDVRRYWMPKKATTQITFLDGDLDDNGLLSLAAYYEHNVFMNGSYRNWFVCLKDEKDQDSKKCPICMSGNKPSYVAMFTVIDHSEWTAKKTGKVIKDQRRLFVAKGEVIDILMRQAIKRGGLAGVRFEVTRSDAQKSNSTGTQFDFEGKEDPKALMQRYGVDLFDYEEAMPLKTKEELIALGFGEPMPGSHGAHEDEEDAHDPEHIPF